MSFEIRMTISFVFTTFLYNNATKLKNIALVSDQQIMTVQNFKTPVTMIFEICNN